MAEISKLGRYELRRILGKGAMGVVYEAFDPSLSRRVAVKTILKSVALDPETERAYSARFIQEAKAVARLNHPNIVQVHDFGVEGEVAYLVMEFIQGRELRSCFEAKERFAPAEVVRIMGELLDALDFAHEAGVIHRDVKPANLMLDSRRRAKLADFGVARIQESEHSTAGTMVGTPAFMSPEQIKGGKIDRRTDIFSAGVVLYQLLTGEQPFKGEGAWTVAKRIVEENPPPPSSVALTVSPAFDAVVNKALAKLPAQRFASAGEFATALRSALADPQQPPAAVMPKSRVVREPRVKSAADEDATVAIGVGAVAATPGTPAAKSKRVDIPAIAAVAVIVAGIGAYLLLGRTPSPAPSPPVEFEKVRREAEERVRKEFAAKAAAERAGMEKALAEKTATEKAAAEKLAQAKIAADKAATEKAAAKAAAERLAVEKAAAEKAATKAAAERVAVEKAAAEKAAAEKLAAEKATAEKAAVDKAAADNLAAERAAVRKVADERAQLEKATAEKARSLAASLEQFKARHPNRVVDQEPPRGGNIIGYGGQIYVNDKSCPPGQIKELTGGNLSRGIDRESRCISLSE